MENIKESTKGSMADSFVSYEDRTFKYRLGKILASSLSGFLAGIVVAVCFLLAIFDITFKQ